MGFSLLLVLAYWDISQSAPNHAQLFEIENIYMYAKWYYNIYLKQTTFYNSVRVR